LSSKSEYTVINEITLIAKAVKRHLNEPDCKHDIRTIVNEALNESKAVALTGQQQQTQDADTLGTNQNGYSSR
jgi:hypothetical protein